MHRRIEITEWAAIDRSIMIGFHQSDVPLQKLVHDKGGKVKKAFQNAVLLKRRSRHSYHMGKRGAMGYVTIERLQSNLELYKNMIIS